MQLTLQLGQLKPLSLDIFKSANLTVLLKFACYVTKTWEF